MKEKLNFKNILILIIIALVGIWLINNMNILGNLFNTVFSIIFPFILGGCLAFILNIPMTFFEKKFSRLENKKKQSKKKNGKILRIGAILFSIIIILLILMLIIRLILPELIQIVKTLIDNIPYYVEEITKLVENNKESLLQITEQFEELDASQIKTQVQALIPNILNSSISIVGNIAKGISTFFIAIVFAIYILIDKEKLQAQATRLLYAYLKPEKVNKIIKIGRLTKNTFQKFLTVQCLEASILGTLCIIGMLILKIPYAMPIGVLIGVTALIPVVGAFIGVIVGAILIVVVNPIKVITFVIFVLILQQIEGNLIYPRVVGSSIGLPGMWVLFAVTVGGSLGGILGMLLGVPIATIIYTIIKENTEQRIKTKC